MRKIFLSLFCCLALSFCLVAQQNSGDSHEGHDHSGHDHSGHDHSGHDHSSHDHSGHDHGSHDGSHSAHTNNITAPCGSAAQVIHHEGYDPSATAIHHISDANVFTIMDMVRIPLPMIIYNKDRGMEFFMSSKFSAGHHDDGHHGYKDYVMMHGNIHRLKCPGFADQESYEVAGFDVQKNKDAAGKEYETPYAIIGGKAYEIEQKTIWDGGLLGGGITSFYDLSPTKNVVSMILVCLLFFYLFRKAAKAYANREGQAPSGIQSFLEPVVQFIRDDVAIPFIGEGKYERFFPLLLTIFVFILGLNLWGQVPFLGSVNVTGSLTVTAVLAIIVFLISNFNGNKHYWQHIFNMPGVPWFVKIILTPVELLGMFIKPLTLMLRLAGNISAGHIAILSFVGLIFIFGNAGQSTAGSITGVVMAIPLTIFMMAIELIVAFVQAFVFTLLAASYIGAAIEDHDHH